MYRFSLVTAVLVAAAFASAVQADSFQNLAQTATGMGLLPTVGYGNSLNAITDRTLWVWGGAVGPRFSSSPFQPYLTWNTPQNVRTLRIFEDWNWGGDLSQIYVDTLNPGGSAGNEADWTQRYDSGSIATILQEIDLGATYSTQGVRVRASYSNPTGDHTLGEVEVFGAIGGTLASQRVNANAAAWTATSTIGGTSPNFAGVWTDRWLSQSEANTGGSEFDLDRHYDTPAAINLMSIAWRAVGDNGNRAVPSHWTVQVKTTTNGDWTDAGTFSSELNNLGDPAVWYYNQLPNLTGVTDLRVKVLFSDLPDSSYGVGVPYSETFNIAIPEPATMSLLALGGMGLLARRRARR